MLLKFFSDAGVAENCADPVSRRIRVKGPSLAPCPGSPIQQRHCVENAEVGGASPSRDTTTEKGALSKSRTPVLDTGGEGAFILLRRLCQMASLIASCVRGKAVCCG